jgi:hypothetical protein
MGGYGSVLLGNIADAIEKAAYVVNIATKITAKALDAGIVGAIVIEVSACGARGIAVVMGWIRTAEVSGMAVSKDSASCEVLAEEGLVVGEVD